MTYIIRQGQTTLSSFARQAQLWEHVTFSLSKITGQLNLAIEDMEPQ